MQVKISVMPPQPGLHVRVEGQPHPEVTVGETATLMDITGYELPILVLGENLSCATHKGTVSVSVALERVHKPRGGVTEIAVDAHYAGLHAGAAIGLA